MALKTIFPHIKEGSAEWNNFIALDKNKKADYLNAWIEKEAPKKLAKNPGRNIEIIKNTLRVYVWNLQGLLSKIGYDANPKNMPKIDTNASVEEVEITREDVEKLYAKLNQKYALILKVHFLLGGLNPADIVELRLNDFKKCNDPFYYIYKPRSKTERKGGKIFNVIHDILYDEIKEFVNLENLKRENNQETPITPNDPIFQIDERTISDEFRYVLEQNGLNAKTIPKYIRQLAATLLEEVLTKNLDQIWTQQIQEIKTDPNFVKDKIPKLIEYYPKIFEVLGLGNEYKHKLAVEQDIRKENAMLKTKIDNLEGKFVQFDSFREDYLTTKKELKEFKKSKLIPPGLDQETIISLGKLAQEIPLSDLKLLIAKLKTQ